MNMVKASVAAAAAFAFAGVVAFDDLERIFWGLDPGPSDSDETGYVNALSDDLFNDDDEYLLLKAKTTRLLDLVSEGHKGAAEYLYRHDPLSYKARDGRIPMGLQAAVTQHRPELFRNSDIGEPHKSTQKLPDYPVDDDGEIPTNAAFKEYLNYFVIDQCRSRNETRTVLERFAEQPVSDLHSIVSGITGRSDGDKINLFNEGVENNPESWWAAFVFFYPLCALCLVFAVFVFGMMCNCFNCKCCFNCKSCRRCMHMVGQSREVPKDDDLTKVRENTPNWLLPVFCCLWWVVAFPVLMAMGVLIIYYGQQAPPGIDGARCEAGKFVHDVIWGDEFTDDPEYKWGGLVISTVSNGWNDFMFNGANDTEALSPLYLGPLSISNEYNQELSLSSPAVRDGVIKIETDYKALREQNDALGAFNVPMAYFRLTHEQLITVNRGPSLAAVAQQLAVARDMVSSAAYADLQVQANYSNFWFHEYEHKLSYILQADWPLIHDSVESTTKYEVIMLMVAWGMGLFTISVALLGAATAIMGWLNWKADDPTTKGLGKKTTHLLGSTTGLLLVVATVAFGVTWIVWKFGAVADVCWNYENRDLHDALLQKAWNNNYTTTDANLQEIFQECMSEGRGADFANVTKYYELQPAIKDYFDSYNAAVQTVASTLPPTADVGTAGKTANDLIREGTSEGGFYFMTHPDQWDATWSEAYASFGPFLKTFNPEFFGDLDDVWPVGTRGPVPILSGLDLGGITIPDVGMLAVAPHVDVARSAPCRSLPWAIYFRLGDCGIGPDPTTTTTVAPQASEEDDRTFFAPGLAAISEFTRMVLNQYSLQRETDAEGTTLNVRYCLDEAPGPLCSVCPPIGCPAGSVTLMDGDFDYTANAEMTQMAHTARQIYEQVEGDSDEKLAQMWSFYALIVFGVSKQRMLFANVTVPALDGGDSYSVPLREFYKLDTPSEETFEELRLLQDAAPRTLGDLSAARLTDMETEANATDISGLHQNYADRIKAYLDNNYNIGKAIDGVQDCKNTYWAFTLIVDAACSEVVGNFGGAIIFIMFTMVGAGVGAILSGLAFAKYFDVYYYKSGDEGEIESVDREGSNAGGYDPAKTQNFD